MIQSYKKICFLMLLAITCLIGTASAQSIPENCEEARKKYLEQNTDVAKVNMDPWNHYQSFGKKEGRKWPDCSKQVIETANAKTPNSSGKSKEAKPNHLASKIYYHDCIFEHHVAISDDEAYCSFEEFIKKYEKISENYPIVFQDINGSRVCSVYYISWSSKDLDSKGNRVVHRGDFTEEQLSRIKTYKFQRLEDCLVMLQMFEELACIRHPDENSIVLVLNLNQVEVRTIEDNLLLGQNKKREFYYKFEKLKNKYLTVSLKHPACYDTIIEIDKRRRSSYVRMNFSKSFLQTEFNEFKAAADVPALRMLQAITLEETLYREIAACADSIEIDNCLKQGSGAAIEKFITDRPYSPRYQDALKVRQYYKDAEANYTSAKSANTIKEYEYFLKNFDLSIHKEEVKQLLVAEACRYYKKDVGGADSLLHCYKKYIIPNKSETWIKTYESDLKYVADIHLGGEFSKVLSSKKPTSINEVAACLQRLKLMEKSLEYNGFQTAKMILSQKNHIVFTHYFEELKKVNSAKSQDSVIADFLLNYEAVIHYQGYIGNKPIDTETVLTYIFRYGSIDGKVNLYNTAFLSNYLKDDLSIRPDPPQSYTYKGKPFTLQVAGSKTIMEWTHTASNYDDRGLNTLANAEVTTYDNTGVEHKLKFSTEPDLHILSYSQDGKLIVEKYCPKNSTINYTYEFDNGVNISLKALSDFVIAADKAINEKKLAEAERQLVSAKNTFPEELPENTRLAETWTKYKDALEKHNAEVKRKEEEDRRKREAEEMLRQQQMEEERRSQHQKPRSYSEDSEITSNSSRYGSVNVTDELSVQSYMMGRTWSNPHIGAYGLSFSFDFSSATGNYALICWNSSTSKYDPIAVFINVTFTPRYGYCRFQGMNIDNGQDISFKIFPDGHCENNDGLNWHQE